MSNKITIEYTGKSYNIINKTIIDYMKDNNLLKIRIGNKYISYNPKKKTYDTDALILELDYAKTVCYDQPVYLELSYYDDFGLISIESFDKTYLQQFTIHDINSIYLNLK